MNEALRIYIIDHHLVAVTLILGMALMVEIGWQVGRRAKAKYNASKINASDTFMAAIFGLLALVIAITFSGASDRFDKRRDLIMNELSTISSAYLSIDLLKAEDQPKLRALFKKYVDLRLQVYKKPMEIEDQAKIFQQRLEIGNEIWQGAVKAVKTMSPLSFADTLVAAKILPTISAMFDASDYQRVGMKMHPPPALWVLLFLLAFVGSLVAGYIMGIEERRDWLLTIVFIIVMVATISLVLDIEHPRDGMINLDRVDQEIAHFRKSM
ncbi:hypothetical protein [Polynucleobacter sp. IMCC 29146]|uniref:bestrophin-like domain n=1 Tax=Polynucleobacter sp. IMCC 29146 TaxID=2780953 RepID=UPI001F1F0406|nr:hypothetical protein [Polynucleobacter sp. IMCC 29146]MCE7530064.1 hypothetical protein [Polynucleobacter sp. IMCC 29146]